MVTTANITGGPETSAADSVQNLPGLAELAQATGIPAASLVRALELEVPFHGKILNECDPLQRRKLYENLYSTVHPLLATETCDAVRYERLAKLFAQEFRNKSVLDVGCGDGSLLRAIREWASPANLAGIDIYGFDNVAASGFTFFRQDIIAFRLPHRFDVVVSSDVIEHIAPADVEEHLRGVRDALKPGGTLVMLTPNRLWGPHDITRAYDFTNANRIPAAGSHLNELTYSELIGLLQDHGFRDVKTVIPFANRLPIFRQLRIAVGLNLKLERSPMLRSLTYAIKRRGRALYKNPIVLIAKKA
jgi:SAM-dependent methyltransferase